MTKNEALQMCLEYIETDAHERKYVRHAIKAALKQPVQRPWVGLTDDDWAKIEDMSDAFDQGVAWAQARLRERNNG